MSEIKTKNGFLCLISNLKIGRIWMYIYALYMFLEKSVFSEMGVRLMKLLTLLSFMG